MRSLILYLRTEVKVNWVFHFGLQEWVSSPAHYSYFVSIENLLYHIAHKDEKLEVKLREVIYK